jgi:DNA-binding PadR family transcriptional regulator
MAERPLPHLQFAVLGALGSGTRTGREIREELRSLDLEKTGPTFYRLMTRLEEAGFVEGWYEQEVVDGQIFRERAYRALPPGERAWRRTRDFHLAVIGRHAADEHESPA